MKNIIIQIKKLINIYQKINASFPLITFVAVFITGILFWGAFNTSLHLTNSESFCISCHEMRDYVYKEYKETIHYSNRTGVRATCPDCHVPKEWPYMVAR
ncbi:MAG: NapC/NirT family cytochrome c, partial [Gammaproteobacteria bacterium]|nr:NapC/NirT family cytochrome c [Gammaproteobacteria bacterium]